MDSSSCFPVNSVARNGILFATQLRTVLLERSPVSSEHTSAALFITIIQAGAPQFKKREDRCFSILLNHLQDKPKLSSLGSNPGLVAFKT